MAKENKNETTATETKPVEKTVKYKNATGAKQELSLLGKNYKVLSNEVIEFPDSCEEEFKRVSNGAWFKVN